MLKWRLVLTTMPWALLIALLSYLRQDVWRLPAIVKFSELSPIIMGAVFIIGFMLAGVMGDHKAGEGLPGQLASALASYLESIDAMAAANGELDAPALREDHRRLVVMLEQWVLNSTPVGPCFDAIDTLHRNLERSTVAKNVPTLFLAALNAKSAIRNAVSHINGIRTIGFIPTGYALLQGMNTLLSGLLIFADFADGATGFLVAGMLSLILICFTRLIIDLDNPFGYRGGTYTKGSNEINPEALLGYAQSIKGSDYSAN